MKNLVVLVFFSFLVSKLGAQLLFNGAFHSFYPEMLSGSQIEKIDNEYFVSLNHAILKYRNNGNMFSVSNLNNVQFYKSGDKKLFCVGNDRNQCDDYFPATQKNIFKKIDTSGAVIFSHTLVVPSGNDYVSACQLTDSSYCVFTKTAMLEFSVNGILTSSVSLGFTDHSACLALPSNSVLLSALQNSVAVLTVISLANTVQTTPFLSTPFIKFQLYNGQSIIGLNQNGSLYKFTPNLVNIAASGFSSINDFSVSNDTIYCISNTSYFRADTAFNIISTTTTSTQGVFQKAIHVDGTKVAICSDIQSYSITPIFNSFNISKDFTNSFSLMNKLSTHNYTQDLQISEVVTDTLYCEITGPNSNNSGYKYLTSYKAKVKVKNLGNHVVNKFKLNCVADAYMGLCATFFMRKQFSGLNMLPGDSIIITSDLIQRWGSFFGNSVPTVTTDFCFYTTVPNDQTDKLLSNSELCKFVSIIPTSIHDYNFFDLNTRCFPNPFTNKIKVESDYEIQSVQMMDVMGRKICEYQVKGFELELPTEAILPGLYLLKISTEKGAVTKKVLKE